MQILINFTPFSAADFNSLCVLMVLDQFSTLLLAWWRWGKLFSLLILFLKHQNKHKLFNSHRRFFSGFSWEGFTDCEVSTEEKKKRIIIISVYIFLFVCNFSYTERINWIIFVYFSHYRHDLLLGWFMGMKQVRCTKFNAFDTTDKWRMRGKSRRLHLVWKRFLGWKKF